MVSGKDFPKKTNPKTINVQSQSLAQDARYGEETIIVVPVPAITGGRWREGRGYSKKPGQGFLGSLG